MEVSWRAIELIDGDGCLTPVGQTVLRDELDDERLAIVTILGSRATSIVRRRLIAELLRCDVVIPQTSTGVTLLACVSYIENDYSLLILDVGDAANPVVGSLCALSSLVISSCDTDTAIRNSLPSFPPFQETLQLLRREYSSFDIYELLPNMLTLDFSREGALFCPRGVCDAPYTDMMKLKQRGVLRPNEMELDINSLFGPNAVIKRLFGVELVSGAFLALLESLGRDAKEASHDPDLSHAWDEYVEHRSALISDDASSTYMDCMQASLRDTDVPMELDAFERLHDELWRLAMDIFRNGANQKAPSRRIVRAKLKADLKKYHDQERQYLHEKSRTYCEKIRKELWEKISSPILLQLSSTNDGIIGSHAFRALLGAIHEFDKTYNIEARGPEKISVLRNFYRHEAIDVFQQLDAVMSQQITDAHLKSLRTQLETDFEAKKQELIEHFKQEEAQLRLCMTREMEMMQKVHQAKSSRIKIDENECKRLRCQVTELMAANVELERQRVVLEHASEDANLQKIALEIKVSSLESNVQSEMVSRAEVIDTLASTVKASEEREVHLQNTIAELQIEVKEKGSRIETELRDLSMQLRKTNEEKEELQKKLNDFFLRVTALPDSLQQQFFCEETGEGEGVKIGFADALSRFMG